MRLARATAEAEVQALAVIRSAMTPHIRTRDVTRQEGDKSSIEHREERVHGDWRAAAWYLERKHPERYKQGTEVSRSESRCRGR